MSAENGKMHTTTGSALGDKAAANKPNGMPPKLSSLKPARDLTLGGRGGASGAAKKVFTPNLNVTRNKNANVKTSKDTTTRGRGGRARSDRGTTRGGAGGRGGRGGNSQSTLIQTAGVFSEGAGAINLRKSLAGSSSHTRADDAPSAMRKPTLVRNELQNVDLKAEASQVHEILGDSEDDQDLFDDKTDAELIPIKLNEIKWKRLKSEIKVENDLDPPSEGAGEAADAQQQHQIGGGSSSCCRYPKSMQDMLEATQPQIFVMQLPDMLPCEDDTEADETAATSNKTTSDSTPASTRNANLSRSLRSMDEGLVGKLIHYKSGKVKLILGNSHFNVDMGMETGFLQDLMSISANREERSGNMINLGPIQAKLTATPDWEHLLKHQLNIREGV